MHVTKHQQSPFKISLRGKCFVYRNLLARYSLNPNYPCTVTPYRQPIFDVNAVEKKQQVMGNNLSIQHLRFFLSAIVQHTHGCLPDKVSVLSNIASH